MYKPSSIILSSLISQWIFLFLGVNAPVSAFQINHLIPNGRIKYPHSLEPKWKYDPAYRSALLLQNDSNSDKESSKENKDDDPPPITVNDIKPISRSNATTFTFRKEEKTSSPESSKFFSIPPFRIEDTQLLYFDVFLLQTLSIAITTLVTYRNSAPLLHITEAFSEGSLICLLWILAGLHNGAFLKSAVDGHSFPSESSPQKAGVLALNTFIPAINLRIIIALVDAVLHHRHVGEGWSSTIPLELGVGLMLMSSWRMLHSAFVPRI